MFRILPLCLCLPYAAQPPGETAEAKAARQAIAQVLADQVTAWNKGDLKAFMAGYLRSDETTFYSGATVIKGYSNVLARYEKKYQGEGKEMGKVAFKDMQIDVLSADSAVVRGRFELTLSNESPSGLFTLIFRKTADGWRIVHDHTSN